MSQLQTRKIGNTGVELTSIGLGTSPLGGCGIDVSYEQFEAVILAAFDAGIRYFDTAPLYGLGKSEHYLGHILRTRKLRDQVVISTKAGRVLKPQSRAQRAPSLYGINWVDSLPYVDQYDYTYDGIMRAFEDSQQRMGIDGIDILYLHDVSSVWHRDKHEFYLGQLRASGYKPCDELRSSGAVKAIGLGVNETASVLEVAAEFNLDCSMVAGRYTLLNHAPLNDFFPEVQRRGISIIAAGVYNSGILAEGSKANTATATYDCGPVPADVMARVERLEAVCRKFGVSLPTAATQFVYSHPAVTAVVQGALSPAHVEANVAAISAPTPVEFWDDLRAEGLIPEAAPVSVRKAV